MYNDDDDVTVILIHAELTAISRLVPIPVTVLSKASVCGCSLAGIEGLNPARGHDACSL